MKKPAENQRLENLDLARQEVSESLPKMLNREHHRLIWNETGSRALVPSPAVHRFVGPVLSLVGLGLVVVAFIVQGWFAAFCLLLGVAYALHGASAAAPGRFLIDGESLVFRRGPWHYKFDLEGISGFEACKRRGGGWPQTYRIRVCGSKTRVLPVDLLTLAAAETLAADLGSMRNDARRLAANAADLLGSDDF